VTYDLVVEGATEGISAYIMTIDVGNDSVAGIDGFEHANDPMFDSTQVSNGAVNITTAMGEDAIGASNQTMLGTLTLSGESAGTTAVAIDQSSVEVGLDDYNVSDHEVGAVTGGSLDVSQRTAGVELMASEPVTTGNVALDVVVTGVDGGIGAYDVEIDSNDQSATFVDYELTPDGDSVPFDNSEITDDGSTLSPGAALGDTTHDPAEEVQIATVTVNIDATGTFAIGFEEATIQDTDSNDYAMTTENVSLSVDPGPPTVPGGQGPPQNLGIIPNTYEDVDGDGSLTIFDVQKLFTNMDSPMMDEHAAAFSFNNGDTTEVTIFDVQALFGIL
jgi:hypothetical protein